MPRFVQAAAFFGILSACVLPWTPDADGATLFTVLVTASVVAVTLAYVIPWVYVDLGSTPVEGSGDG